MTKQKEVLCGCGGEMKHIVLRSMEAKLCRVKCYCFNCKINLCTDYYETVAEAITAVKTATRYDYRSGGCRCVVNDNLGETDA